MRLLTRSQILELIYPADPDNLIQCESGAYEATWSPSNPHAMDVEIIRRTPGIRITLEPHSSARLARWTAILFRVEDPKYPPREK